MLVAFRTHLWSPDIAALARRLTYFSQGAAFTLLADETHGELPTGALPKLAHDADFSSLGLPNFPADRRLWYNADYPLYLLRAAHPNVTHFAMVEYDVAVNTDVAAILRAAAARNLDLIAHTIIPATPDWAWHYTVAKHFSEPKRAFMPFLVISARAIDALLAARRSLPPPASHADWPFAEGFIPSVIATLPNAAMEELRQHASLPHFDWRGERHLHDPTVNQLGTICHPVTGGRQLAERHLRFDPPEAILDPQSELRQQLLFADPAEFTDLLAERLRGSAEHFAAFRAQAAALNWKLPETPPPPPKKYLVIARAGRNSLHQQWLQGAEPRFDLVICPYQEIRHDPDSFWQSRVIPGQKWSGLARFFEEWPDWRRYDYIWLPDDDLAADAQTLNTFFTAAEQLGAAIAAPALSEESFYSHAITMRNRNFFARAVTFIEVMMPCFRSDVLERALPSIATSATGFGWGLDSVWPMLVNYENVLIFDGITVRHTRPVGAVRDPALSQAVIDEMNRVITQFGAPQVMQTLGGYDAQLRYHPAGGEAFLRKYLEGYYYLMARQPNTGEVLLNGQRQPVPRARPASSGNIALGKPALISSLWHGLPAQHLAEAAAAGNNGRITGAGPFHTELEIDPWWQVDLQRVFAINRVILYNRLDFRERCTRVSLLVSLDGEKFSLAAVKLDAALFGGADGNPYVFTLSPAIPARIVRVALIGENYLHLDEIEIFGDPA